MDNKLCTLEENVTKIRRTVKGGLLLQLRRSGGNTANFGGAIGELLGESASIRTLKDMRTIEIKDIDEITKKEDIYEAIRKISGLETFGEPDIIALRRAYGGTQTATVGLKSGGATILLR